MNSSQFISCDTDVDGNTPRSTSGPHQINSYRAISLINGDIPCLKLNGNHWN